MLPASIHKYNSKIMFILLGDRTQFREICVRKVFAGHFLGIRII